MERFERRCKTTRSHAEGSEIGPDTVLLLCSDLLFSALPIDASAGKVATLQSAYAALTRRSRPIPPDRL